MSDLTPRLLSKTEAAAYCGIKASRFSQWVQEGIIPPAIPGTHKWDKRAIDAKFDQIAGIQPEKPVSALAKWIAERDAKRSAE